MTLRIVSAGPTTDWRAVHGLLTRSFAYMERRIDPPSSLARMDADCLASQPGMVLLATDAETGPGLVGCLFARPRGGALYLGKIAVEPAYQGRGAGRALVDAAEAVARREGIAALELQTRIELVENHAAFTAMGFEKTAETAHPGFDRPTSVTMRKRL